MLDVERGSVGEYKAEKCEEENSGGKAERYLEKRKIQPS